jgi:hypothetical protein
MQTTKLPVVQYEGRKWYTFKDVAATTGYTRQGVESKFKKVENYTEVYKVVTTRELQKIRRSHPELFKKSGPAKLALIDAERGAKIINALFYVDMEHPLEVLKQDTAKIEEEEEEIEVEFKAEAAPETPTSSPATNETGIAKLLREAADKVEELERVVETKDSRISQLETEKEEFEADMETRFETMMKTFTEAWKSGEMFKK